MHSRAAELARTLALQPHPEGGAFREVFRASAAVSDAAGATRAAMTHIYFLLAEGQHSRWHRVAQDEVWNFYEGDPLELCWIAPDWGRIVRRRLSLTGVRREPVAVVPAGCWQMARATGAYALAGCTVAPGFEFADFTLLADDPEASARLEREHPGETRFLAPAAP